MLVRALGSLSLVLAATMTLATLSGCNEDGGGTPAADTASGDTGEGDTGVDATGDAASTDTTDDAVSTDTTDDAASTDTTGDATAPGITTVSSSLLRDLAPNVSGASQQSLVSGNTAFALDLYHAVGEPSENLFLSPASVSIALAMTYAGAAGETAVQMADTLHYELPTADLHPAFDWLDLELNSRGEGAAGADGEEFRLHVVNALWGQTGYAFLDSFLDLLAVNYGAGMTLVDFENKLEEARLAINAWVSEMTEDRIPELIPAGLLSPSTRLVLTNAVYFNAAWDLKFDEDYTEPGDFELLDGTKVEVPLMNQTETFALAESAAYQAIELPYDGGELSMVLIAPTAGTFGTFEQALTPAVLDGILTALAPESVWVTMPRYTVRTEAMLGDTLKALGMSDAFEYGTADFSAMDGTKELFIGEVIHKTFVTVNEAGTEAAAATAVVMVGGGMPKHVALTRPFIFVIRDLQTGTVLFMGRVVDPSIE